MGRNKEASRGNSDETHNGEPLRQYNDSEGHFSLVRCAVILVSLLY